MIETVPAEPFRERFIYLRDRNELTASQLCWHMGWVYRPSRSACSREGRHHGHKKPNTSHAAHVLGLTRRTGCQQRSTSIRYETALPLSKALGLDPFECGL